MDSPISNFIDVMIRLAFVLAVLCVVLVLGVLGLLVLLYIKW